MSIDDFCRSEIDEFESICDAWRKMREAQYHDSWERTRTLAAICIQPHIKKRITPRQLIPLPWDDKSHKPHSPKLTPEERRIRFEQIAKKMPCPHLKTDYCV
ncbi:hypothetical protein [uncultured Duncaniella sp.]|uniref:hypothetical protein n=1 Tax=uncultured Duncaniella sp. TaxID=2768039 RepID=UPI00267631F1|nr:hypothetical protein [uncultured Duncaniella sp.]